MKIKFSNNILEKKVKPNLGFTLIEIISTLMVFMIAVIGLTAMHKASIEGVSKGKDYTAATNIALFFITQLKSEISAWPSYTNLPAACDNTFWNNANFTAFNAPDRMKILAQNTENICLHGAANGWKALPGPGASDGFKIDQYLGHSANLEGAVLNEPASKYCVNYFVEPMDALSEDPAAIASAMVWKIRVLVAWPRRNQMADWIGTDGDDACNPTELRSRIATGADTGEALEVVEMAAVATREFVR